jgi:hypothetical protein
MTSGAKLTQLGPRRSMVRGKVQADGPGLPGYQSARQLRKPRWSLGHGTIDVQLKPGVANAEFRRCD